VKKLATIALEVAKSSGGEEVEVVETKVKEITIQIASQAIHTVKTKEDKGIGVRVYYNRGMGFSYTMQIEEKKVQDAALRAVELAKCSSPDPLFCGFPTPQSFISIKGLFDKEITNISGEKLIPKMEMLIEGAVKVNNKVSLRGELSVMNKETTILNSRGIEFCGKESKVSLGVMSIVNQGPTNVGCGYEVFLGRHLDEIDFNKIGKEATEKAVQMLSGKELTTKKTTFLLSPLATWGLTQALGQSLNAYKILQGKSFFTNKIIGKQIASEKVTLIDDGTISKGFFSSPVDGEGVPKHRFTVIHNGILTTYLHNSNTSKKMKVKNNACSVRSSYKSLPQIRLSNVEIIQGEKSFNSLLSEIDEGVYIDSFPFPDPITGYISSMIDFGIEIKRGKLTHAVKNTMIGVSFKDLLLNIEEISKERRNIGGSLLPYLLIKNIQIAGK